MPKQILGAPVSAGGQAEFWVADIVGAGKAEAPTAPTDLMISLRVVFIGRLLFANTCRTSWPSSFFDA
jgi:hypothetical protein